MQGFWCIVDGANPFWFCFNFLNNVLRVVRGFEGNWLFYSTNILILVAGSAVALWISIMYLMALNKNRPKQPMYAQMGYGAAPQQQHVMVSRELSVNVLERELNFWRLGISYHFSIILRFNLCLGAAAAPAATDDAPAAPTAHDAPTAGPSGNRHDQRLSVPARTLQNTYLSTLVPRVSK